MENRKNIKLIGKNVFESTGFHITRTLFITTQVYRVISTIRKNLVNIIIPAGIYLFKVNSRNTTARCEICSKLTIKTRERWQWHRSGVLIVNFEQVFTGWVGNRQVLFTLSRKIWCACFVRFLPKVFNGQKLEHFSIWLKTSKFAVIIGQEHVSGLGWLSLQWTCRNRCGEESREIIYIFKPLSANPTKWSNTLKQFVGKSRQIIWACLTILCGWRLKV